MIADLLIVAFRWFHSVRLVVWIGQFPLVFAWHPELKQSIAYVIFLSIAALVESALSDVYNAWEKSQDEKKAAEKPPPALLDC